MSIKIYVDNKCYQCWLCKNKVGSSDHHGLPECKVENKYMYEVYEEPCHCFEPTEKVKDLIIKSTDVQEVVHGKWIASRFKTLREDGWCECSVCGVGNKLYDRGVRKSDVPYIDGKPYELKHIANYCPNCGAKMEVEK